MTTVLITGNTFPVKDQIKALGGRWDAAAKGWNVPTDKADEAQALVAGAPVSPRVSGPSNKPSYTPKVCRVCGVKQYTKQLGVAGQYTFGNSVATDPSANVYVAGQTLGGLDGNTITGNTDFFVTKYDSNGVKQYTKQLGVAGKYTYGFSVATDASANIYVAGQTEGGLDGNTLTGTRDFFVTKYSSSGVKQFTKQLGVAGKGTYGHSVATDTIANVYVAGYTYGGLDGNMLTGTGDFFVSKYNSNGVKP